LLPDIHAADFAVIGTLVVLEGLLSADNALVLALLVRHLPANQQKKALLYGLVGAFLLRGIGIFFAGLIIHLWWFCALGSAYLIILSIRHFLTKRESPHPSAARERAEGVGFWPTVCMVELTDLFFAIDSILVAVALVNDPNKLWIVYTGGFLGILLLRLAATFFIKLIERYPALDTMAYLLVGWAGVKLASAAVDVYHRGMGMEPPHVLKPHVFWAAFALIILFGIWHAARHRRKFRGGMRR
jgi:YkoY family integral membrane protein